MLPKLSIILLTMVVAATGAGIAEIDAGSGKAADGRDGGDQRDGGNGGTSSLVGLVGQINGGGYDPATSSPSLIQTGGFWFGVAGFVTAIGTTIFQPWLASRGLAAKVKEATDKAQQNADRITDMEAARKAEKADWVAQIAAKDLVISARESELLLRNTENRTLLVKLTELTDRNIKLSAGLMAQLGKIQAVSDDRDLSIADGPPDQDGPRVLLVEDDQIVLNAFSTLLTLRHCRTTGVGTVYEAMEALHDPPDVVILDLNLPADRNGDADGLVVLRAIKDRKLPCRVIVTTGRDSSTLDAVRALNPTAILTKPVDFFKGLLPVVEASPGARA